MKFRHIVLFSGERFDVPQCIQRIDHRATHGWQLRYGGTKLFSDHSNDGSGASTALEAATRELIRRMQDMPAPTTLQRGPSANKSSDLPPGISGPIMRERRGGRVKDCSLAILLPRFGKTPVRRSLYIGTEHTYTKKKFAEALKVAVALREEAEKVYLEAATKARKSDARALQQMVATSKRSNDGRVGAMAGGLARRKDADAPKVTAARKYGPMKKAVSRTKPVAVKKASAKKAVKTAVKVAVKAAVKAVAKKAAKTVAKKAAVKKVAAKRAPAKPAATKRAPAKRAAAKKAR